MTANPVMDELKADPVLADGPNPEVTRCRSGISRVILTWHESAHRPQALEPKAVKKDVIPMKARCEPAAVTTWNVPRLTLCTAVHGVYAERLWRSCPLATEMEEPNTVKDLIRAVLDEHGHLSKPAAQLSDLDDLYQVGLTSHATVNVMLALESATDIEFPDVLLKRATFGTIDALAAAAASLKDA